MDAGVGWAAGGLRPACKWCSRLAGATVTPRVLARGTACALFRVPINHPFSPPPSLPPPPQYAEWVAEVLAMKEEHPLAYPHHEDVIMPQWAIEVGSWCRGARGRLAAVRPAAGCGWWLTVCLRAPVPTLCQPAHD